MKKVIIMLASISMSILASAQTMNVHFKNGTKVEFSSENVDYVDFTEKPSDPTLTAGDYVDLGLSVKWASCNLGATKPTESGGYYAWGETTEKKMYTKENYAYYNSTTTVYTDIGANISGTEYDAAYVNLGRDWRMPTYNEFRELEDNCTWVWTSKDGVYGYVVTGKNGNSIFIPASGYKSSSGSVYDSNERGDYWCDKVNNDASANYFNMSSSTHTVANFITKSKYYGLTIRPVYSPSSDSGISNITDYVVITRTGTSIQVTSAGMYYVVTFSIENKSSETIHLNTLAGVDISTDLEGGKSYSVSLQSRSQNLQNYYQTLVFTYNGKSYEVKG